MNEVNYNLNDGWSSLAAELLLVPCPREKVLIFYEQKIRENGGCSLDPACGAGRHVFALLKRGLEMHGADASGDALQIAQRTAKELGFNPPLIPWPWRLAWNGL